MTPCRPENPQPRCAHCERTTLPTQHRTEGYVMVDHVVMDPTAVLPTGRPCPLYAPMVALKEAA